jgi:hypothetical protein
VANKIGIKEFVIKEFPIVLTFGMYLSSFWSTDYFNVFLIIPISVYILFKYFRQIIDFNIFVLVFFCIVYTLYNKSILNGSLGFLDHFKLFFFPTLFYAVGKYLALKYNNIKYIIIIFSVFTILFCVNPFVSSIVSIFKNGFMTTREIILLGSGMNERPIGATILASFFSLNMALFPFFFTKQESKFENIFQKIFMVLFIIGIIVVSNSISRTGFIIMIASFFFNFLFLPIGKKVGYFSRSLYYLIPLLTLGLIVGFYDWFANSELYVRFFLATDQGDDLLSDRSAIWQDAWKVINEGNGVYELEGVTYAHNLWLDILLKSGILSVILNLTFVINYLILVYKILIFKTNQFFRTLIICITVGFFGTFMVEPIMDGYASLFYLFCLFYGIFKQWASTNLGKNIVNLL